MIRAIFQLILFVCISLSGHIAAADKQYQDVPLKDVPMKVITAAHEKLFDMDFVEAELVTDDDGTEIYEFKGVKDREKYFVQVDMQGKVLKFGPSEDFEEEILERHLSDLPETVRTAAEEAQGGLKLTGYRTERIGFGSIVYEVEGTRDGQCYEVEIDENGNMLGVEECD